MRIPVVAAVCLLCASADASYALSFAAMPAASPDEYHEIEVKIVGQPKLKAQTRTGYYAQPLRRAAQ